MTDSSSQRQPRGQQGPQQGNNRNNRDFGGSQSQRRGRPQSNSSGFNGDTGSSVSDSRGDFEDLKAQNQQIIELLKRINQSIQNL